MRTPSSARPRVLMALTTALLAACSDVSGPAPTNDPVTLVARMRVIDSISADRLLLANGILGLAFHPPRDLTGMLHDSVLGRTFEWDVARRRYLATARAGAPPRGVRHVLYLTGGAEPAVPLAEIGATDLLPLTSATPAVRSVVTGTGAFGGSSADLRISLLVGETVATIEASGSVHSAGRRADVRARFDVTPEMVVIDATMEVPARDLLIRALVATYYFAGGTRQEADIRLQTRGEVLTMQGWIERLELPGGASYATDLTLHLNGAVLATLAGVDTTIEFRDPDGAVLTGDLAMALGDFYRAPGTVQGSVASFIQPSVRFLSGL